MKKILIISFFICISLAGYTQKAMLEIGGGNSVLLGYEKDFLEWDFSNKKELINTGTDNSGNLFLTRQIPSNDDFLLLFYIFDKQQNMLYCILRTGKANFHIKYFNEHYTAQSRTEWVAFANDGTPISIKLESFNDIFTSFVISFSE